MVNMGSFYHNRSGVVNACFGGIASKQRDSMYPGAVACFPQGCYAYSAGLMFSRSWQLRSRARPQQRSCPCKWSFASANADQSELLGVGVIPGDRCCQALDQPGHLLRIKDLDRRHGSRSLPHRSQIWSVEGSETLPKYHSCSLRIVVGKTREGTLLKCGNCFLALGRLLTVVRRKRLIGGNDVFFLQ